MKLTALQKLAEAQFPPKGASSREELSRRTKLEKIEGVIESLRTHLEGNVLKKILADGQFPATESKALLKKFDAFASEFEDFKMGLLFEFDQD